MAKTRKNNDQYRTDGVERDRNDRRAGGRVVHGLPQLSPPGLSSLALGSGAALLAGHQLRIPARRISPAIRSTLGWTTVTTSVRPSRDTVIRLGLAMQLPMEDMDELLLAAGYAPLVR